MNQVENFLNLVKYIALQFSESSVKPKLETYE